MNHCISIDVEEWFHVCRAERYLPRRDWDRIESRVSQNVEQALDFLRRRGIKATFFILGYVADRHPAIVPMIEREGHEIGIHGYGHERVDDLTEEEFQRDISAAIDVIGGQCAGRLTSYRAPEWSIHAGNLRSLEILRRHGVLIDSSVMPAPLTRGRRLDPAPSVVETPAGPIREFPCSTMTLAWVRIPFLTSAALRLLPIPLILQGIRSLEAVGIPFNLAIHSWDLDPAIPRVPVPMRGLFRYVNSTSLPIKLDRLVSDYRMSPIREVFPCYSGNCLNRPREFATILPARTGECGE